MYNNLAMTTPGFVTQNSQSPVFGQQQNADCGMSTKVIQQEILNTMREVSRNLSILKESIVPQTNQCVHLGIQCENCKCTNLIGIRYKCFICENYNLCQKCETYVQSIHPPGHCFLKLYAPETMQEIIANNYPCTIVDIQKLIQNNKLT